MARVPSVFHAQGAESRGSLESPLQAGACSFARRPTQGRPCAWPVPDGVSWPLPHPSQAPRGLTSRRGQLWDLFGKGLLAVRASPPGA